jgi:predicted metal-binding membrane protein
LVGLSSNTIADTVAGPSGTGGPSWLTGKLAQISIIVLGLLLIAAGVFSFDKTKELVLKGAKTAGAVAA